MLIFTQEVKANMIYEIIIWLEFLLSREHLQEVNCQQSKKKVS